MASTTPFVGSFVSARLLLGRWSELEITMESIQTEEIDKDEVPTGEAMEGMGWRPRMCARWVWWDLHGFALLTFQSIWYRFMILVWKFHQVVSNDSSSWFRKSFKFVKWLAKSDRIRFLRTGDALVFRSHLPIQVMSWVDAAINVGRCVEWMPTGVFKS